MALRCCITTQHVGRPRRLRPCMAATTPSCGGVQVGSSVVLIRAPQLHGCALESSFREGVRREQLRSLAQVANQTLMPLEVALVRAKPQPRTSRPSATPRQQAPVSPWSSEGAPP